MFYDWLANRIDVILNCVKHELNDLSLNTSNIVQRCTQKGWDISYVVAKQKVYYLPHFLVFSVLPNPSISLGESFITQVFDWYGVKSKSFSFCLLSPMWDVMGRDTQREDISYIVSKQKVYYLPRNFSVFSVSPNPSLGLRKGLINRCLICWCT